MKDQWAAVEDKTNSQKYFKVCEDAASDKNKFNRFRRNEDYYIVESPNKLHGSINLNVLKNEDPEGIDWIRSNIEELMKNDKFGGPKKFYFFGKLVSSSTIQYASDLFRIKKLIQKNKISSVVEVGPGYGGLARLIIKFLCKKKYVLIDMPSPLKLIKKYLKQFNFKNIQLKFIDAEKVFEKKPFSHDLFVASGSLAELDIKTQQFYFDNYIKKSSFSYIIYNTIHIEKNKNFLISILENLEKSNFKVMISNPFARVFMINIVNMNVIQNYDFESFNFSYFNKMQFKNYLSSPKFIIKRLQDKMYYLYLKIF